MCMKTTQHLQETPWQISTDAMYMQAKLTTKDTIYNRLTAKGIIRSGTLWRGDITVGEVYDAANLGKGNDGLLDVHWFGVYMKGSDLIKAAELDCVGKDMMVDGHHSLVACSIITLITALILNRGSRCGSSHERRLSYTQKKIS